eukprot:m.15791 g.15791  ORF g.15791 m.15791 type:complete len:1025 (-) comp4526_c0_seq1:1206-4280(-)
MKQLQLVLLVGFCALAYTTIASHAFTQLSSCIAQTCTPDPNSNCDQRWESTVAGVEAEQSSIENQASQLFSLSGNAHDSSPYLEAVASIEKNVTALRANSLSTITTLQLNAIEESTLTAEQSNYEIQATTASQNDLAQVIGDALDATVLDLNDLTAALDTTEVTVGSVREFLCPANVPHAEAYHFSGQLTTSSSYGTFQLETGSTVSDILISFETQDGPNSQGGILLRHGSADGFGGLGVIIGLTSTEAYALVQCQTSNAYLSLPFMANSSVLHTASLTRTTNAVFFRVDGEVRTEALSMCSGTASGNIHIGTPNRVQVSPSAGLQGSFVGCIRTISVDEVTIVQKSQASSAAITVGRECRSMRSDYLIVLDVSSSIPTTDAVALRAFLATVTDALLTPYDLNVRVGVAQFAGDLTYATIVPFSYSQSEVLATFDANFRSESGRSFIGSALIKAAEYFSSFSSDADSKILYILTDGDISIEDTPLSNGVSMLQNIGVKSVAFGVGTSLVQSNLLQIAQGIADNVVTVGLYALLDSVSRDYVADSCVPKLSMLGLFAQSGIVTCGYLDCADFVAHSSQLPTVETFIVVDNARIKRYLLSQASETRLRLQAISDEVSLSVSSSEDYRDNTFLRLVTYLDSTEYQSSVSQLSTNVEDYVGNVSSLSVLVGSLFDTALQKVSIISQANSIATHTRTTLSTSVSALTVADSTAISTLRKARSIEAAASIALDAAQNKLSRAVSLNARVQSTDTKLSSLRASVSRSVSSARTMIISVTSSVAALQPFDVLAFSTTVSGVVSELEQKVDLRVETLLDASGIVDTHQAQEITTQSLQSAFGENSVEHSNLVTDLSSIEAGLSASVSVEDSNLSPRLSAQVSLVGSLSKKADDDIAREASSEQRLGLLRSSISSSEEAVNSIEVYVSHTSNTVSQATECFELASATISSLDATRSSIRKQVDTTNTQLSSVLSGYSSTEPRLSQLDLNQQNDATFVSQQLIAATSLSSRYTADKERAVSLSQVVESIADECFQ